MKKFLFFVVALLLMSASFVFAGGRPLTATLTGAAEVPSADPDGSGVAHITLNQGQGQVCFDIDVENISPPTRAHIHQAQAGVNGPIVVHLFNLIVPEGLSGCIDGVDKDLIKDIRQNPDQYYVNVHNADFPGGAVRGQLSK